MPDRQSGTSACKRHVKNFNARDLPTQKPLPRATLQLRTCSASRHGAMLGRVARTNRCIWAGPGGHYATRELAFSPPSASASHTLSGHPQLRN